MDAVRLARLAQNLWAPQAVGLAVFKAFEHLLPGLEVATPSRYRMIFYFVEQLLTVCLVHVRRKDHRIYQQ